MLAMAAARRWNAAWEECEARGGFIIHGKKQLRFAELVDEAIGFDPPDPPVLRPEPARERQAERVEQREHDPIQLAQVYAVRKLTAYDLGPGNPTRRAIEYHG